MPARGARTRRIRRAPDEARRAILAVAEKQLIEGGPDAVRIQVLARELGVSDAAVHHHFGSRQGLLEELLLHAGRALRDQTEAVLASWDGEPEGLRQIAEGFAAIYADRGYARLAQWLSQNGWKSRNSGMFEPLVDAVHQTRLAAARDAGLPRPRRQEAQFAVALLNLGLCADPLMGEGFLRSVELAADAETRARFRRWMIRTLVDILMPEPR